MHATMAIFNAWCDRMPMLMLGATGPVDAAKRRPWIDWIHTARDQGALVRGYTKWDDQPASPAAAREALLRAGWIANTAPRGPTYVNLDAGMQEEKLAEPVPPIDAKRFMPPVDKRARRRPRSRSRRRLAAQRQASADPGRPRVARSRRVERARRARRATRRARRHRSEGRRRLPDRSSAACRRARHHRAGRRKPATPSARPTSSSASTGSTSPAPSSMSAMSTPRSSRCRSTISCTTAGAWTTRACRRSMC